VRDLCKTFNLPALNDVDVGTCSGTVTAEQTQLFANRNNAWGSDVVVYFVRSTVPSFNGCATFPSGRPGAVVAQIASQGQVRLDDQLLRSGGDLAYEVGTEHGEGTLAGQRLTFEHRVTNVYLLDALLGGNWAAVKSVLQHLVLPSLVLSTVTMPILTRLTRSTMLEVLSQDYVRTARAKGLTERAVIFGHVLRAASPPVITVVGLAFGNVMTGTVLVENIFSWPGVGQYSFRSATTLDLPAIVGVMLFVALVYILANLAVDVLYGVIDPRVRLT